MKAAVISWVFPKQSWNPQSIERICTSIKSVKDYFEGYYPSCIIRFREDDQEINISNTPFNWVYEKLNWDELGSIICEAYNPELDEITQTFMIQVRNIH